MLFYVEIQLQLLNTWGDPYYIGLTGLAVLGVGLEPLPLAAEQLTASPRDLNDLPEYTDDDRTLDKLAYSHSPELPGKGSLLAAHELTYTLQQNETI